MSGSYLVLLLLYSYRPPHSKGTHLTPQNTANPHPYCGKYAFVSWPVTLVASPSSPSICALRNEGNRAQQMFVERLL